MGGRPRSRGRPSGQELSAAGKTFAGYSEGLPGNGYTGCAAGLYARKHNPWVNFASVPASSNPTFGHFPTDYATLPTVSFVIPNLCDDMHNCPVSIGDTWLRGHLDGYVRWARTHSSLLVLTWDEDDNSHRNQLPTVIVGAGVKAGTVTGSINHYAVPRTIADMYHLPHAGASASAAPIAGIWTWSGATRTGPLSRSCHEVTGTVGGRPVESRYGKCGLRGCPDRSCSTSPAR